jgi:tRNA-2-methylthio-N6-dimethylallyladenosine synthase
MHRGYTAERYLARLDAARVAISDLAVTTDLIVGFPGETEDDFADTLAVIEAASFDSAYTFVYSPRPGTPAAEMTAQFVSPEVTRDRMDRLTEAVERHALVRHHARIEREESVLVDGPSKTDATRRSGRTRQGKLVHFAADEARAPAGAYVTVRITGAAPHWLAGEFVAMVQPPRRVPTRIPVSAA